MDDEAKRLLGNNLRHIRWIKGWSQQFVCTQANISIRTLSRGESGHGLSKKTLSKLAVLYRVPVTEFYQPEQVRKKPARTVEPLPFDTVVRLLGESDFISRIQQETVLNFNASIQGKAAMMRTDVEDILPKILNDRASYTKTDLIMACIAVSNETVRRVGEMAAA